ncbi:hypothetical protein GGR51DRAFT_521573 [Nemania sp. FL0031]|nr:hypothetical protein GGR51DRAFT_521573 [Nemania sp. FL0031]
MPTSKLVLPETVEAWHTVAEARGLKMESIFGHHAYKSASAIEFDQFLLLRVICPRRLSPKSIYKTYYRSKWLRSDSFDVAVASLKAQEAWKPYIKSTPQTLQQQQQQQTESSLALLGLFSLVRYYQLEVTRTKQDNLSRPKLEWTPIALRTRRRLAIQAQPPETPTRPPRSRKEDIASVEDAFGGLEIGSATEPSPDLSTLGIPGTLSSLYSPDDDDAASFKAANDEQIVNTALLLYLNALAISCSQVQGHWTLHRKRFVLESKGEKVYEARVDGYLCSKDNEVKAIVEVKPYTRSSKLENIRMQEAAQMAAWINSDPPNVQTMREQKKTCRRLLISQDHNQIFITIAEFDADYVDYICDRPSIEHSLLEMQEYGPFRTDDPEMMEILGYLMLGFTIDESVLGS